MNILLLDSSALGARSASRELSAGIVADLLGQHRGRVVYRDLDSEPLPHLTAASLHGADAELAAAVLAEFFAADIVVIGAPMYNFGIPSTLKAWIDRIAVAGKTFRYGENGPQGLAGGRRVIIASIRGGVHGNGATDFQENYLRMVFGFIGIEDVQILRAEGLAMANNDRSQALAAARRGLQPGLSLAA